MDLIVHVTQAVAQRVRPRPIVVDKPKLPKPAIPKPVTDKKKVGGMPCVMCFSDVTLTLM